MKRITTQHLADFRENDYLATFGVTKAQFDRMLAILEATYQREHRRKPRFTKINMLDKLVITLVYRSQYCSMESIAAEYGVSRDTVADNIHWVERVLLDAHLLEKSVTCVYRTI